MRLGLEYRRQVDGLWCYSAVHDRIAGSKRCSNMLPLTFKFRWILCQDDDVNLVGDSHPQKRQKIGRQASDIWAMKRRKTLFICTLTQ